MEAEIRALVDRWGLGTDGNLIVLGVTLCAIASFLGAPAVFSALRSIGNHS